MAQTVQTPALSVINGGDEFLNSRQARQLRDHLRGDMPEAEIISLDAQDAGAADLWEAASPSLLSTQSIVIIDNLDKASDELVDALVSFAQEAKKTHNLDNRVIARKPQGQKGQGILNQLSRAGAQVIAVADFDVNAEFAAHQRTVTAQAAQRIRDVLGSDSGAMAALVDQLCDDTDANPVDIAQVDQVLEGSPEVTGFQISDAAFSGNAAQAIVALRDGLSHGIAPAAIIGALAAHLRQLTLSAVDPRKLSNGVFRSDWVRNRYRKESQGWTSQGIIACFQALAQADSDAKSSGADPLYRLESAVELIARKGR